MGIYIRMFRMGSVFAYELIWMNLCTNSGLWLVTGLVGIYGVSRAVTVLYQRRRVRFGSD